MQAYSLCNTPKRLRGHFKIENTKDVSPERLRNSIPNLVCFCEPPVQALLAVASRALKCIGCLFELPSMLRIIGPC